MDVLRKVGRVAKPFGTDGELILALYDTFPEEFDTEEPLFADVDSLTVPLFLQKFEPRGRSGALVRFDDFDTDERAAELVGLELSLCDGGEDGEEEDDDVIYFEDLVGFAAAVEGTDLRGEVAGFIDSDMNPLLEVAVDGRVVYVPAVDEMISMLDVERREVEFSLPEGLLDLYME